MIAEEELMEVLTLIKLTKLTEMEWDLWHAPVTHVDCYMLMCMCVGENEEVMYMYSVQCTC